MTCVIVSTAAPNQGATFAITDTNLYVPFVTLSTQDNVKLIDQLKSDFKRTINWNKYQSKASIQTQTQYSDFLIDPSFQEVNRLFLLSFEDNVHQTSYNRHFFPTAEIKDNNVTVDEKNFFDQPVKNDKRTYDNVKKLQLVKGMIIQPVVYYIMFISNIIK